MLININQNDQDNEICSFPLLLNPGRLSTFSFNPQAVELPSCTVVRLKSLAYTPS